MKLLAIAALAGSMTLLPAQSTGSGTSVEAVPSGDNVTVFNAQLNGPNGLTNGKLVVVGDRMVFVDDERPQLSFAVGKNDVRKLTFEQGELSVDLGRPVTDRWGSRTNLILRTDNPQHIQSVVAWAGVPLVGGGSATVRTDESQDVSTGARSAQPRVSPGVLSFDARHDHSVGNCYGKLLVSADGLRFESVGESDHSRSWKWNEIDEVDRNGSEQKVIIKPHGADHFALKLSSQFDEAFRAISERLVAARPKR